MTNKRRSRGYALEPEQRSFIDQKLKDEKLSVKAAEQICGIGEKSLRNALNGKHLDEATIVAIIDGLAVPDVNKLKQDHNRLFNIQRERNHYFTGREDKIEAIRTALQSSQFAALTQALSGLGGAGKTSTAVEYAYRCLDRANFPDYPRYRAIQFARADTADVLKDGYASIAKALLLPHADPNNREEAVRAVLRWMMQPESGPWLLILDNLDDDLDLLNEFLPKPPQRHFGHVLITSRSHRFANRIKRVDIEAMDEEEGVTFLYRRTERTRTPGSKEEQAAREIVAEMGGLPLALEQAGAYMTSGIEMSFEDYMTGFRSEKQRSEQMNYPPEYGDYRFTVRTTWHMSLAKIKPHHPEAVQLLQLCAFLYPIGIPKELVFALLPDYFASAGEDVPERNVLYNNVLNVLTRYSLIQRDLNNNTHSVHVMLQTVLRDALTPGSQKQAHQRILTAIVGSFPSEDYVLGGRGALYYPHAELMRQYVEQTGMKDERVGLLLSYMGAFLYYLGRFNEAECLYHHALEIQQTVLHADHPNIAMNLNNLAELYRSQGRFDEAEPLMKQALVMRQKALPASHYDILESLNNLASLYQSQGRFDEAEPLYLESLQMKRKWHPDRYHTIAVGLNNLAKLYWRQGRWEDAELLYLEALEMMQKRLPEDYHIIAASLNNLAELYYSQGRFDDAEPLYEKALETWPKAIPEGHPDFATSLNNLAILYWSQGRYTQAEPLYLKALQMRQKALPEGHPDIAQSLNNQAGLYESQGRYTEAEPLYLQALQMRQKALPEDHPDIAQSLNDLAGLYESQGRYPEAEPLYLQALEIVKLSLPPGHPAVATCLNNLAGLYKSQERYTEAELLYLQALQMRQPSLPSFHHSIARSLNNLAGLYTSQRRYSEAERLYLQALEIVKLSLPADHPDVATSLNNLAALYRDQGRFEEGESSG